MPKEGRTRRVTQQQVRSYLGKAEEFLAAARESLTTGHTLAATSLAVHAAISAGDAICGARTGKRAAGADHAQAAVLLGQAGREGTDAARLLTRLMPLKNRAESEPQDVPQATATRAVDQAERIVATHIRYPTARPVRRDEQTQLFECTLSPRIECAAEGRARRGAA